MSSFQLTCFCNEIGLALSKRNEEQQIHLERDFLSAVAVKPSRGDELPFLLGDRDFLPFADALLPRLDFAFSECSLPLRDFTESLDLERLLDFLVCDPDLE